MSKNFRRVCIILGILFVVFSAVAFAVSFERTAVFWIAYVFGAFAIAFQTYIFKTSLSGSSKSRFYGFPIARLGVYYLVAQLAVSLIEMAFAGSFPVSAALIANLILAALALIGCITTVAMRDENARQDG